MERSIVLAATYPHDPQILRQLQEILSCTDVKPKQKHAIIFPQM